VIKKQPYLSIPIGGFGRRWKVRISRYLRGAWGYCNYDKREIVICKTTQASGIEREILIHELLHKIMPFLDEECVRVAATEIDDALEACGY